MERDAMNLWSQACRLKFGAIVARQTRWQSLSHSNSQRHHFSTDLGGGAVDSNNTSSPCTHVAVRTSLVMRLQDVDTEKLDAAKAKQAQRQL
eukprot:3070488-Amphidinium_carterae.1